jgi:hypothetical protein
MIMYEETEENQIRADKWHEMDIGNLNHQRDLIMDKLNMLRSITATVTILNIIHALTMALDDVEQLLNERTSGIKTGM